MDAKPLNFIRPEVPAELAAVVAKMLAKEPERRYQTPAEVAEALKPFFRKDGVVSRSLKPDLSQVGRVEPTQEPGVVRTSPTQPQTSANPASGRATATPRSEPRWETLIDIKETEAYEAPPAPAPRPARHKPRWFWPSIAAASSFVLMAMGVIIYIITDYGRIKIIVDGPNPEVKVDGKEIQIKTWGESITLRADEHDLAVRWRDGRFKTKKFTVRRGDNEDLSIEYELLPKSESSKAKTPLDSRPGHEKLPVKLEVLPKSEAGKNQGPRESLTGDRDRRAAETVLSLGGSVTVRVNGRDQPVEPGKTLPTGALQLTHVRLTDAFIVTDPTLAQLRDLPHLIDLGLDGTGMTDAGLVHLAVLPTVRGLRLERTGVTNAGLAHLKAALPQLNFLLLGHSRVTDDGMIHLGRLTQLEGLWLEGTRVGDAGIARLRGLAKLRSLLLWGTRVTDAGLANVQTLTQLEGLMLGGTRVTDKGLANLKNLPNLKGLWLDSTQATDAGLAYLQGLAQLEDLNLSGTNVTDAGLVHLRTLTRLNKLRVQNTLVTSAGVEELKRSLPACEIIADTGSRGNVSKSESGKEQTARDSTPGERDRRAAETESSVPAPATTNSNGQVKTTETQAGDTGNAPVTETRKDRAVLDKELVVSRIQFDEAAHRSLMPSLQLRKEGELTYAPKAYGREHVIFTHPVDSETPARIDFSKISEKASGRLTLWAKSLPGPPPGGLVVVKVNRSTASTSVLDVDQPWRTIPVVFNHEKVVVEHKSLGWQHEGMFFDYQIEDSPVMAKGSKTKPAAAKKRGVDIDQEPTWQFQPPLSRRDNRFWHIGVPELVVMDKDEVVVHGPNDGSFNFLVTRRGDFRASSIKVELTASPGTIAFLAVRAGLGDNGWYGGLTSKIFEQYGKIRAGMKSGDFREDEWGRPRRAFRPGEFFTVLVAINEDRDGGVGVNEQGRDGAACNCKETGAVGVFVKTGTLFIRSLRVSDK